MIGTMLLQTLIGSLSIKIAERLSTLTCNMRWCGGLKGVSVALNGLGHRGGRMPSGSPLGPLGILEGATVDKVRTRGSWDLAIDLPGTRLGGSGGEAWSRLGIAWAT